MGLYLIISLYYHIIHLVKNIQGFLMFLITFFFMTCDPVLLPSGNLYHTSIILGSSFFLDPLHVYLVCQLNSQTDVQCLRC